jgi:hypothetical protein
MTPLIPLLPLSATSLHDDDASSVATTVPGAIVVVIDDETDVCETVPDTRAPMYQGVSPVPGTATQDNVVLSNVDGVSKEAVAAVKHRQALQGDVVLSMADEALKEDSMSIPETFPNTARQDDVVLSMVDEAWKEDPMNIHETFLDTARQDNFVQSMVEEALRAPKSQSVSPVPDMYPDMLPDTAMQDNVALTESLSVDSYSAAGLRRDNDVTPSEPFPELINKHYNPNPHRSRSPDRYYLQHGAAASSSAAPVSARFPFDIHRFETMGEACRYALVGHARHGAGALCSMLDGTVSYDGALTFARRKVQAMISSGSAFYIGISEAPQRRFDQHLEKNSAWEEQVVLVEAANSGTTASLEIALLALFGQRGNCTNASGGGECRSSGSPHYVYVLIGTRHRRSR